jgi:actin-related protein
MEVPTIVVDVGSLNVKAGFAGEDKPSSVSPNCVGYPRYAFAQTAYSDPFVGDEALFKSGILRLSWPVKEGQITEWDDWERVMHHTTYNEMRVAPEEHSLLMTEGPEMNEADRERVFEFFFETLPFQRVATSPCAPLILFANGQESGVALDVGLGEPVVSCVVKGGVVPNSVKRSQPETMGGAWLAQILQRTMTLRATAGVDRTLVNNVKERCGRIRLKGETEWEPQEFELPDGQIITIGEDAILCAEHLFEVKTPLGWDVYKALLAGISSNSESVLNDLPKDILKLICAEAEKSGLPELIQSSLRSAPAALRRQVGGVLAVAGGGSLFSGFPERLAQEVKNFEILAPIDRAHSAWKGGSILGSLPELYEGVSVSKADYEELGKAAINRK